MHNALFYLLFRLIAALFDLAVCLEALLSDFIRHVYLPIVFSASPQKMVNDIATFAKKPQDEVTLVVDVRVSKPTDLMRTALKVIRYSKIIEEGVAPKCLNCLVATNDLSPNERLQFRELVASLKPKASRLNLQFAEEVDYLEKLKIEKTKATPLVLSFCSYPSIGCLSPHFLVGAEISFSPAILKSCDYDVFSSLQKYSLSEQRKGK